MIPANKEALAALVGKIVKDVCEIDPTGKWNREDNPELIVMTVSHLENILRYHLCGESFVANELPVPGRRKA